MVTVQGTLPMDWTPITMRLRGMGLLKTSTVGAMPVPSPSLAPGGDVETGGSAGSVGDEVVEQEGIAKEPAVIVIRKGSSGQSSVSSPRVAFDGSRAVPTESACTNGSSLCARLVAQCCETRPVFDQPQPPTAAERAAEMSTLQQYVNDRRRFCTQLRRAAASSVEWCFTGLCRVVALRQVEVVARR